jgi:cytochrome c553
MVRAAIAAAVSLMIAPAHLSAQVDYDKDVRPILAASCFGCHGPRQQQSGLRLDLRQNALRGAITALDC